MALLIRPQEKQEGTDLHCSIEVTPASAGWRYVSFAVYHLRKGQLLTGAAEGQESALIVLSGIGEAHLNNQSVGQIGERLSVFEEKAPYVLYLSEQASYSLRCSSETMEVAIASTPASGRKLPARLIRPNEIGVEVRGEGKTLRRVQHLLDTDQEADRLILVEVITPAGNWSSFPPHKHDTENPPHESYLEETYYHRLQPADGFAFQRVYNYEGLDETLTVHDGDLVLVPKGYHVVAAMPGCDLYYLNVMAGPTRLWNYQVDPAFRRLLPPSGKITGTISKPQ
ncbi:5-deoxy-glucuronate isomerase [Ktedonosporobacter rubrisoli]|uniref:5-deoxy-glucuronate isomerase n=1 Tax=Ktedonosporobacter rubrisoli TaxID=2509675 RepID=A0A4P6JU34_KTERU|nr:5-deoxy-glucuronate isomerase [Ktedonosporobacter rubrisoli]QBD78802.1 5-deoxy-glucuronate isomerase [Ktedonosporobacter rubrisoli]